MNAAPIRAETLCPKGVGARRAGGSFAARFRLPLGTHKRWPTQVPWHEYRVKEYLLRGEEGRISIVLSCCKIRNNCSMFENLTE